MVSIARRAGIDALGSVPWGTHVCHLYDTKQDLIDVLVPYFKAGLESNELCIWVTSEPLEVEEAKQALSRVTRELNGFMAKRQIEILDHGEWYTTTGRFDATRVLDAWTGKVNEAATRGFDGLRAAGNISWLEPGEWREFIDYEAEIESSIGRFPMLVICSYRVSKCDPAQVAEVVQNHRLALVRKGDDWQLTQSGERRRAEQELHASLEFNSRLIVSSPSPVMVVSLDTAIRYANPALEKLTGFTSEELLGTREPYPWWTEETERRTRQGIEGLVGRTGVTFEDVFRARSGSSFWAEVTLTPIRWNSELGCYLETWVDITERKRAELQSQRRQLHLERLVDHRTRELIASNEELRQEVEKRSEAEKKLRQLYEQEKELRGVLQEEIKKRVEFTRALAHELKTPLTPVVMSSETLVGQLKDDENLLRVARNIQKAAKNLDGRIDELLDLARGEVGMLKLRREPVDVLALLREVVEEEAPVSARLGLAVAARLPAALPPVQADKVRLRQIVLNLLSNAFKHTLEGGRVTVSARQESVSVIIEVSDTGIGITKKEQERIFDPYHRVDNDRQKLSGLGLGLALCKTLVELHGGRIWVKSRRGKGSAFGFSIPIEGPGGE